MTATSAGPLRWLSAARSHVGLVREVNEDACLDQPAAALWAVADGMGGHALGDLASRSVIDALRPDGAAADRLEAAADEARRRLQAVNRYLCQEAERRGVRLIGSTVAVLIARDRRCACLWAGDSRIYLLREGRLVQISRDHTQVAELLARGELTAAQAAEHPLRHLVTRAVGAAETLEVEETRLEAREGDVFLLCSDGLSNEVGEAEIGAALTCPDCDAAAGMLLDLALRHGGRDNVTLVVARPEDCQAQDRTVVNPALQ